MPRTTRGSGGAISRECEFVIEIVSDSGLCRGHCRRVLRATCTNADPHTGFSYGYGCLNSYTHSGSSYVDSSPDADSNSTADKHASGYADIRADPDHSADRGGDLRDTAAYQRVSR